MSISSDYKNAPTNTANHSHATLSHLDSDGEIHMVDVGHKTATTREAHAVGQVYFPADIYGQIKAADGMTKKGSITQTAHIAGIMAAKRTHDLIPLCHPLGLDHVTIDFDTDDNLPGVIITATCSVTGATGVEMEAMTAVSVAGLTIYDMCKAVDRGMEIGAIRLTHKSGGKSGVFDGK